MTELDISSPVWLFLDDNYHFMAIFPGLAGVSMGKYQSRIFDRPGALPDAHCPTNTFKLPLASVNSIIIVIIINKYDWHKLMLQDHLTKISESRAVSSQKFMQLEQLAESFVQRAPSSADVWKLAKSWLRWHLEREHSRLIRQRLEKQDHQRLTVTMLERLGNVMTMIIPMNVTNDIYIYIYTSPFQCLFPSFLLISSHVVSPHSIKSSFSFYFYFYLVCYVFICV